MIVAVGLVAGCSSQSKSYVTNTNGSLDPNASAVPAAVADACVAIGKDARASGVDASSSWDQLSALVSDWQIDSRGLAATSALRVAVDKLANSVAIQDEKGSLNGETLVLQACGMNAAAASVSAGS
jgi:hypothetical protein